MKNIELTPREERRFRAGLRRWDMIENSFKIEDNVMATAWKIIREIFKRRSNIRVELSFALKEAWKLHKAYLKANAGDFTFTIEKLEGDRNATPYVARLSIEDGRIERTFKDLPRDYNGDLIAISGNFKAKAGDIIEVQTSGSWKNKYRDYFIITEGGEMKRFGRDMRARTFRDDMLPMFRDYLNGKKSYEDFMNSAQREIDRIDRMINESATPEYIYWS